MLKHLNGKKWYLNTKPLLIPYKAQIRFILEYSSLIRLSIFESNRSKFEPIQAKALRTISKSSNHLSHTKPNLFPCLLFFSLL